MKTTLKVKGNHTIYTFFDEAGKILGFLGMYRNGKKQLTAAELLEQLK